MEFNQSEFEKNLLRRSNDSSDPSVSDRKVDANSIYIKDADDVPINTYEGETPRDRAAKLAAWEAQKGKKPAKSPGKASDKADKPKRRVPKSVIYISCVIAVSLLLTIISWLAIRDCFAFHNKVSEDIPIVVEDGEGLSTITGKLSDADIIDFPFAFRLYYSLIKKNTQVQYGTHYFKKGDDSVNGSRFIELWLPIEKI